MSYHPGQATSSHGLQWRVLPFASLSLAELYAVLQLRTEVFVLEQNCVFQDMDGADTHALHVLGTGDNGALMAYACLFPAGVKFAEASIGRVVTHSHVRGSGFGHVLIQQAVDAVAGAWGAQPICIGAQAHLKNFYQRHGFVDMGLPYVEDGIDHLEMLRTVSQPGLGRIPVAMQSEVQHKPTRSGRWQNLHHYEPIPFTRA